MLLSELATTVGALEWFFAGVSPLVVGALLIGHELLAAIRAGIATIV